MPENLLLCPILRYVACAVDGCLRDYAEARTNEEKESALTHALDTARILKNTAVPLAREAGRTALANAIEVESNRLLDLARPWIEKHPANFPRTPDRSLQILDILESVENRNREIEARLSKLEARRERRAVAQFNGKEAA